MARAYCRRRPGDFSRADNSETFLPSNHKSSPQLNPFWAVTLLGGNVGRFHPSVSPAKPLTLMPRQPINRTSPPIPLDRHLRMVDQLPATICSQTLFGNDAPLELEVGSGKGLFMQNASGKNPGHNFLGVEIAYKYAAQAAERLAKHDRCNAIMASGNAEPLLEKSIADQSLTAVHIYFPDPWWKKKHKKRRVVNPQSVKHIYRVLSPGGSFHFWTDVLEYFESAIEMIAVEVPQFGPPIPEEPESDVATAEPVMKSLSAEMATLGPPQPAYRTHFERRSRLHQIPVYRVRYDKR
jgi:tRNA (guanine-N7-)-methyltransferase